jgi:glycosyltransferase involved in cell wall biosynthesis
LESLKIVVTGLAATYPFGGVFWDYIQYVLGFLRMGHDVLYLEDTGKWCYDPIEGTFVERGERNAFYLARNLEALDPGLSERWFYRDATGRCYGRRWEEVKRFCKEADLFLHISASCWMKEEYFEAKKVAFLDSDPMYTQASVPAYVEGKADDGERSRIEMLLRHDVFFTFAENIDSSDCLIPKELFHWIPTRQPIVLECFEKKVLPVAKRRKVLTTVASWEPAEGGPVVRGVHYKGKSAEFEKFMDLPTKSPIPLELAMSGKAPVERFRSKGWIMVDAYSVSSDPWVYRDYLASSFGEWSVAKNAYVVSRSGWFSCRSACYLALGVPVVVQDTGFKGIIPSGKGVLPFSTVDEAAQAIEELARDPESHSRAALEVAMEYFRSEKVLSELLERALSHGKGP